MTKQKAFKMLKEAKIVYMGVNTRNDVFYVKISKKEAGYFLESASVGGVLDLEDYDVRIDPDNHVLWIK